MVLAFDNHNTMSSLRNAHSNLLMYTHWWCIQCNIVQALAHLKPIVRTHKHQLTRLSWSRQTNNNKTRPGGPASFTLDTALHPWFVSPWPPISQVLPDIVPPVAESVRHIYQCTHTMWSIWYRCCSTLHASRACYPERQIRGRIWEQVGLQLRGSSNPGLQGCTPASRWDCLSMT